MPTTTPQTLPTIIERLKKAHPNARYELNWENPLQLLLATILAAQATDKTVNQVTPGLFAKYPDAQAFASADPADLETHLKPINFYRNKARTIQNACKELVARFNGEVPRTMDEMVTLPGVARKTANVVLNNAFQVPSGVIVDTHVARVSQRLGLTTQTKPERIEQELMRIIPQEEWIQFGAAMVLLGRYTCTSDEPRCAQCTMNDFCPRRGVQGKAEADSSPETTTLEVEVLASAQKDAKARSSSNKKGSASPKGNQPLSLPVQLPPSWQEVLAGELTKPYFRKLQDYVAAERVDHAVFPPEEDVFNAFKFTPYDKVKVLLLGQDPYHDDNQAHGMCFSVRPGIKPPPSLVNIFKELESDLGCRIPRHGHLTPWARRGVMLLNTVLTVRAHQANSHKERGWETFTDAVIRALSARAEPLVFVLWGASAQKKQELIDGKKHRIVTAAHPSPLSAKKFFGSKPFSRTNKALEELGQAPIDWQLPERIEEEEKPHASQGPAPMQVVEKDTTRAKEPAPPPAAVAATGAQPAAQEAKSHLSPLLHRALTHLHSLRHTSLLPADWLNVLAAEFHKPYFQKLEKFIDSERKAGTVLPREDEVFTAFRLTPYAQVKVVILGGSPSCVAGQSDGLAFSVQPGNPPPPELLNLFRELRNDLGCWMPNTGCLTPWARQGVLLLNRVLTVRAHEADSHRNRGWETFTDGVLRALNARPEPVVFVLWGETASSTAHLLDETRHTLVIGPHPLEKEFLGRRPFSAVNNALELRGRSGIFWQLYAV